MDKLTRWEYITSALALLLYMIWGNYEYSSEPEKIPYEPIVSGILTLCGIWGYVYYQSGKKDASDGVTSSHPVTNTQNADKINNIGQINQAQFSNDIVQNKIEKQYVQYGDTKIDRYLTNPPFYAEYFIGREKDLDAIENHYQKNERLLVLVNGEGGMGKTTLAAKYWVQHQARYKHLAWLYSDSGIGSALVSLANKLKIEFDSTDDEAAQIARITEGVNNLEMPCLLVFDNANDRADLERHYTTLHQFNPLCHILLTSRVPEVGNMVVHKVKHLGKGDALKLFKKYYPDFLDTEVNILTDIMHAVGYNTLVIEVLAKNLAVLNKFKKQYGLADLLHDLQQKGLLAVKTQNVKVVYGSHTLRNEKADSIIEAMYDLSALSVAEKYLLSNFAVLPAENIPYDTFCQLLQVNDDADMDTPLSNLHEKGWIEYRPTDKDFKISPVIQHITKRKNAATLLNDCDTLMDTLIDKLRRNIIHENNYKISTVFVRYAEMVMMAFYEPNFSVVVLCQRIGTYYRTLGNLNRATHFLKKSSDLSKELCELNPNNENFKNGLAISYGNLGETHTALGDLDGALSYYEETNKLFQELYSTNSNNMEFKNGLAISYEKLGSTHTQLGNLDKALVFYEDFNRLEKELYATNPNNVEFKNGLAISYSKLGNAHMVLGNLENALGFYEDYNRLEKELYSINPNNVYFKNSVAISYEKLGQTHTALGNLDKALDFYEENIILSEELYFAYPNNVEFKNGLAISYAQMGEFSAYILKDKTKARTYFKQAEALWLELVLDAPLFVEYQQFLGVVQNILKSLD